MSEAKRVVSLASSKTYVAAQGQIKGVSTLHVQVPGPAGNRLYGYSTDLILPLDLANWFRDQGPDVKSLAATGRGYRQFQVRFDPGLNAIRFQLPGSYEFNREYGAAFAVGADVPEIAAFAEWLRAVQDVPESHPQAELSTWSPCQ